MEKAVLPRTKGRPREFDVEQALETAMRVFWEKGYEGTSLSDLTEAIGINRPSLYAAFGNKEELFRKVLERYGNGPGVCSKTALELPTARAVAERLLFNSVESLTDPTYPRGCLTVNAALSCSEEAEPIRLTLCEGRSESLKALIERFERARAEGDLPASADPEGLAVFITVVQLGMAVQAASGGCRGTLHKAAELAMQAWPTNEP